MIQCKGAMQRLYELLDKPESSRVRVLQVATKVVFMLSTKFVFILSSKVLNYPPPQFARWFSWVSMFLISVSVMTFMLETLPRYRRDIDKVHSA